jgi:hypothetical protein
VHFIVHGSRTTSKVLLERHERRAKRDHSTMEGIQAIIARRQKVKRLRLVVCACAVLLIIVLAIAIPLALKGGRRSSPVPGLQSDILVPLYIYPVPGAWDPLFSAYVTNYELHLLFSTR